MKKLFLTLILLALPLLVSAYEVEVDGIYYNLNSTTKLPKSRIRCLIMASTRPIIPVQNEHRTVPIHHEPIKPQCMNGTCVNGETLFIELDLNVYFCIKQNTSYNNR